MAGRIHVVKEGALGWLIFDQPERRNAISHEMWQALPGAAEALGADPEVRVVLLRGAGELAFVSGADISEFEGMRTGADAASAYEETTGRAFGVEQSAEAAGRMAEDVVEPVERRESTAEVVQKPQPLRGPRRHGARP